MIDLDLDMIGSDFLRDLERAAAEHTPARNVPIIADRAHALARPDKWCAEFLNFMPWERQRAVLLAVARNDRTTVRSGHGVGKTSVAAAVVLWFLLVHDPAIVLTTAPTARQVEQVLWGEIRRLIGRCPTLRGLGTLNRMEYRLTESRFALGLSTNEANRFQGFHSPNILVVIDEAGGVASDIYEAVLGVLTSANARLLLIGNPITPSGFFYDSHRPESGFERIHISSEHSPNVAAGREVVPGLVTADWVASAKRDWGEKSPIYQARVLGEFPESASNALITLADLEAARLLEAKPKGPKSLGCDVARYGDDDTVYIVRRGPALVAVEAVHGYDLMQVTGKLIDLARRHGVADSEIFVDDSGVGGGVTDRLAELGHGINPVNAGSSASDTDLYANCRAEMWCRMAMAVERGELSLRGAPERLLADLAAPTYLFTSRGQRQIERKVQIKARLGRSPDYGDALALTFAESIIEDFVISV